MDDPSITFSKVAGISKLDWRDFLDWSLDPTHTLSRKQRCAALGLSPSTGITFTSIGFLKRMKELGLPGMVIGVSDYQREALMLCLELAFSTALHTKIRHSVLPQGLRSGDLIGFSDTVLEYRKVSDDPGLGTVLEYYPGRKMQLDRFPKLHRVRAGSEINVLNKRRPALVNRLRHTGTIQAASITSSMSVRIFPKQSALGFRSHHCPTLHPQHLGQSKSRSTISNTTLESFCP